MKSYCKNLTITRELVAQGYEAWTHAPAGKKNLWRVADEYGSADNLIDILYAEIKTRTLAFKPFRHTTRRDQNTGKLRRISIACVKYQIATYVLKLCIDDFLHAKLGYYQVAGVEGKGQKLARIALKKWSREKGSHTKNDVRKCYDHITVKLVWDIVRKYIKSDDVLYLIRALLSTCVRGVLEIGTYFSLMMANLVLSFAYHYIEGLRKIRRGKSKALITHQIWHMDDILLMSRDKRDLKTAVRKLERFMSDVLGLALKPWKPCETPGARSLTLADGARPMGT